MFSDWQQALPCIARLETDCRLTSSVRPISSIVSPNSSAPQ